MLQAKLKLFLGLIVAGLMIWSADVPARPVPFASPGEDAGMIVGFPGERARDIYPVKFIAVDGHPIQHRDSIWLAPGKYEISVRIDASGLVQPRGRTTRPSRGDNRIELVVEAGRTYVIGAKLDRTRPGTEFNIILHRVTGDY
ncbi:MAG: hypothetical protein JJU31_09965 [Wenzhouxiangella sp.]|nr:hypothetical protein [Wenzhouxiangella sp.]MCH8477066.1 hypothetical protein [Wenzhouxiangella sp.]TVR94215.1 MAG: hypothetical protein EA418_10620 [Wenzhouxiangellaceae bacterium]